MSNMLRQSRIVTFAALACQAGAGFLFAIEQEDPKVRLFPQTIEMNAFYSGAQLRIEGSSQDDTDIVVVIRGPDREETFNRKARVGPIWINSGKVHIAGVPSLFLCFSSKPVSSFLDRPAIEEYQLDEAAIKKQMRIQPGVDLKERNLIRTHYVALKTEEGTYKILTGSVRKGAPNGDDALFAVELQWPKRAPPASYQVKVYECRNGTVVRTRSAPLEVTKVGFPARLSFLAVNHASLYGLLSVLAAAVAGFGIDFLASKLFGKKRARGH